MRKSMAILTVLAALQFGAGPTSQPADANSDRVKIQELQAKLDSALYRISALEREVAILQKRSEPSDAGDLPNPNAQSQISHWDGLFTVSKSISKLSTQGTVSMTDPTHFILHVEVENGAVWNFECTLGGNQFTVDKFVRIKGAHGPHPADIAGMSGRGKIVDRELSLQYHWLHGTEDMIGTYDLHRN